MENGEDIPPSANPKKTVEVMSWHEIHGARDWAGLLHPLHPFLRYELSKYGGYAQATYDAFDNDPSSTKCGSCRFTRETLFLQLGFSPAPYEVTRYLYATSRVKIISSMAKLKSTKTWRRNSNWMGFVAVSSDEESRRIGRRDVMVAWRGTITVTEWIKNIQLWLEPLGRATKVIHGFKNIYTSLYDSVKRNRTSASEQFMDEVKRLVCSYSSKGEEVSLTVTGHSLGGALAILSAHEAAAARIPGLSWVSVFTFGAPLVGNRKFAVELENLGVKVLRVVNKHDLLPKLPGFLPKRLYTHTGVVLLIDAKTSPFLKRSLDRNNSPHSLETYLHFFDARGGKGREELALLNKSLGLLRKKVRIPWLWQQMGRLTMLLTWRSYTEYTFNRQGRLIHSGFVLHFSFPLPVLAV